MNKKRGLGRGFDSLLPSINKEKSEVNNSNKEENNKEKISSKKNSKTSIKTSEKTRISEKNKVNEKNKVSDKNNTKKKEKNIEKSDINNVDKDYLSDISNEDNKLKEININLIHPDRSQPRKNFNEEDLKELAESIKNHGLIQPITVVKDENEDSYTIVAGERRWRASRLAGKDNITCIVKNLNEVERLFEAVIENVMRKDLNLIEEAKAYERLLDEYSVTHEKLSEMIGKSRSSLSNILRLLNLHEETQNLLMNDKISLGHAKILLQVEDKYMQELFATKVFEASLSVRDLENLIKKYRDNSKANKKKKTDKNDFLSAINLHIKEMQNQFSKALGAKVRLKTNEDMSSGNIVISYNSKEELESIANFFGINDK